MYIVLVISSNISHVTLIDLRKSMGKFLAVLQILQLTTDSGKFYFLIQANLRLIHNFTFNFKFHIFLILLLDETSILYTYGDYSTWFINKWLNAILQASCTYSKLGILASQSPTVINMLFCQLNIYLLAIHIENKIAHELVCITDYSIGHARRRE